MARLRRRPAVEAPPRNVPHGAGEGELGVQPGRRVEVPAHLHVRSQRLLHAAGLIPAHLLGHRLRAEAAHPVATVRRPDAADVGGGAVLRHAAARAQHRLHVVGDDAGCCSAGDELIRRAGVGALRV